MRQNVTATITMTYYYQDQDGNRVTKFFKVADVEVLLVWNKSVRMPYGASKPIEESKEFQIRIPDVYPVEA